MTTRLRAPAPQGVSRRRLDDALAGVWRHRLTVVTGPAGSGKTTLLSQFVSAATVPVAWYRPEITDGDPRTLYAHLDRAFSDRLPDVPTGWTSAEEAAAALDRCPAPGALLVIDDLHVLEGTGAERSLEQLIGWLPPTVRCLVATRRLPAFDLSRLRVSGDLLEVDADDLRFRSWEVERLFRDHYGQPLGADELGELARRTEGWAAGLQLFHLATKGKAPNERRRLLGSLASRSRAVREYLTRNVLDDLSDDLRSFLVRTSVLDRLTGPLCDELLEADGSGDVLRELQVRQIFTVEIEDGTFRYHDVLATFLRAMLLDELGDVEARAWHRRAGRLLADHGSSQEALCAFSRAEAWDDVVALIDEQGEEALERPSAWLASLPEAVRRSDPWLQLAVARNHLANGELAAAVAAYGAAERAFPSASAAQVCQQERLAIQVWLRGGGRGAGGWSAVLRSALRTDPLAARREAAALPGPTGRLVEGLAAFLAGHIDEAVAQFSMVVADAESGGAARAVAGLATAIVAVLTRREGAFAELEAAASACEGTGIPWLVEGTRAVLSVTGPNASAAELVELADRRERAGDEWGAAFVAMLAGAAVLALAIRAGTGGASAPAGGPNAPALFDRAADGFRRLEAGVPEAWARSLAAIARARPGDPEGRRRAEAAEHLARGAGVPGAQVLAFTALAVVGGNRRGEHRALAGALAQECSAAGPAMVALVADRGTAPDPATAEPARALVGRSGELAGLLARFGDAEAGGSAAVRLLGEAGVGKTLLLEHLASRVRRRGGGVRWGRAAEDAPPSWVWTQIVRACVEATDGAELRRALPGEAVHVLGLAPETAKRLGVDPADLPDEVHPVHLADGMVRLLERSARDRPLLVVLDDLHQADPASHRLLRDVARAAPSGVFLVAAYRDDEAPSWLEGLLDDRSLATAIAPAALDRDAIRTLVSRGDPEAEPPDDVVDDVLRVTGGNPAFVTEVVGGLPRALPPGVGAGLRAPGAVRRDVRRRLARLDRPAADLVLKAAVLGAEVDAPLVAVSTGVALAVVQESLQQAVRVRLLVADPDGTLRFVVPAAADVLAADVGPVVRADLHRQAAEHLLRSAPETEARTIARHLLAAAGHVPPQQLTAGVLRVVQAACASGQLADADRWCRSALEALRPGTAGPSRVELLLRHGAVLRELTGEADARAAYLDAAALAATQEDPTLEARAALDLADLVAEWGIPDPQLVGHLESALARLPTVDSALLAQVEARLASQLGADREVPTPRGLDLVNNAIDRAYRVGEARALAVALGAWHETLHGPDHLAARLDTIDEMADQAAIADHRDTMLAAARHRRHSLLQRGDVVAADVELASYGRLSGPRPTGGNAWRLDLMRAGRALLEGRFADAARLSESAEARAGDGPALPRAVQYRFIQDFLLQRELGQLGDLDPRGPNVPGAQDISFTARAIHAYLMGELGQRTAAGIELDRFLIQGPDEIPNGSLLMPTLTLLAQAAVRHEHRAAAEVLYRALLPWSGQAIVVASGSTIWGAVNRLLGELAGVLGSPDDAVAHLDDALVLETRLAAGPLVAHTKVSLAAALSRRGSDGDADRARGLLAEAVDTARALGMAGVLADAEAVATETRPVEVDLRVPAVSRPARRSPDAARKPRQRVQCLGGYRIELGGGPVDLSVVKPRVRAALWLLSIHGGRPVHRERLMDALWPDADPAAGKRNLQVAVSSLRQALEPGVKRGSAALLVRDGDSYRLALDDDAEVDVNKFAAAMAEGEAARRHAPEVSLAAYDEALSWYGGDLIPEAGPAEWIVTWRDARRMEAVDAAVAVAELRAERGEVRAVIAACDRGLYLDRYCDPLWRLQIDAYESAGDHAAAAQARQGYRAVCDELGIDGPTR